MDPVVLFFILGLAAKLCKSDLRLPEALYETLSIYLLLAIGIKGGVELTKFPIATLLPHATLAIILSSTIPLLVFGVLRYMGRIDSTNSGAIAGHYGSVSVVTFAVATSYASKQQLHYEAYFPLLVALMEAPGIVVGILLARLSIKQNAAALSTANTSSTPSQLRLRLLHEVLCGKSVFLLLGGLVIGYVIGEAKLSSIKLLYVDAFKSLLSLFLLELGLVAGGRLIVLRQQGLFMVIFGVLMPLTLSLIGMTSAFYAGMSQGGCLLMACLAASASYIAAPTAMRIALPAANPALSLGLSLGITFPFNIVVGIPLYHTVVSHLFFPA